MYIHPKYPSLFSPLKINKLVLKNRIFYAPVEAYYDRALSGCAVMMRGTSGTLNDPKCRLTPGPWLFAETELPRIKKELMILKRAGALTSLEICHAGMFAHIPAGDFAIGPSDTVRDDGVEVKGMDAQMIQHVLDKFVETAVCAKKIGYDMIMLHFAHGWLPSQFFSTTINKREDKYGGSYENRFRFPKMILQAVRDALGADYPIDMRISAYENYDGAAPHAEIISFISEVSKKGLIDAVNVSYGSVLSEGKLEGTPFCPNMYIADYAEKIKKSVSIPVIVVGKIMTPQEAEEVIFNKKADAVVIARASIADPWWAKKAFECRAEDIVPCIECGKCFDKRCAVQLRNYLEDMVPNELQKAQTQKKVVVCGGGPAGMKAAVTAAQRGHDVTLFEKSPALGGLTKAADHEPHKAGLLRYKEYLITQLKKSSVKILLNTDATPQVVAAEKPDLLILAMGASPIAPCINGTENAVQIMDVYARTKTVGKKVAIIGGGLTGSELAIALTIKGHIVTIIEKTKEIGGEYEKVTYPAYTPYQILSKLQNVTLLQNTDCLEIKKDGLVISTPDAGIKEIKADTVILSVGFKSNNDNLYNYYGITPHTTVIGDLRRPATIRECTEEGYFASSDI
ncbi:MAG: FAD-dependent oxidoreductase [Defluviitaleaceae bacterium]|nr:FAD-dependent oxidoreductase [Defluviitaleaceae bacterium]